MTQYAEVAVAVAVRQLVVIMQTFQVVLLQLMVAVQLQVVDIQ
jgi:hypothetical protein